MNWAGPGAASLFKRVLRELLLSPANEETRQIGVYFSSQLGHPWVKRKIFLDMSTFACEREGIPLSTTYHLVYETSHKIKICDIASDVES